LSTVVKINSGAKSDENSDSRKIIQENRSNEIFFGVVGPVGAGGSRAIEALKRACEANGFACEWIKASELIKNWALASDKPVPTGRKTLELVRKLQDLGDSMRERDTAEVARAILREIAERRAIATGQTYVEGEPVIPDSKKRAYLIDSIRHPAEINLFRRTYANSFALVGVVCEETQRRKRILGKYFTAPRTTRSGFCSERRGIYGAGC
jgi:hypothetical protein